MSRSVIRAGDSGVVSMTHPMHANRQHALNTVRGLGRKGKVRKNSYTDPEDSLGANGCLAISMDSFISCSADSNSAWIVRIWGSMEF